MQAHDRYFFACSQRICGLWWRIFNIETGKCKIYNVRKFLGAECASYWYAKWWHPQKKKKKKTRTLLTQSHIDMNEWRAKEDEIGIKIGSTRICSRSHFVPTWGHKALIYPINPSGSTPNQEWEGKWREGKGRIPALFRTSQVLLDSACLNRIRSFVEFVITASLKVMAPLFWFRTLNWAHPTKVYSSRKNAVPPSTWPNFHLLFRYLDS